MIKAPLPIPGKLNLEDNDIFPPAIFSSDGVYRYLLSRTWGNSGKIIAFVGLNPSTADATKDDPTIRRCLSFAKGFGGTTLLMVNLFAFKATKPTDLFLAEDPIGPSNDEWLRKIIEIADITIAAWGNHGSHLNRSTKLIDLYPGKFNALSVTKSGMPGHPLYLPKTARPRRYPQ